MAQKLFALEGKVQHYAWGGFHYLRDLLNLPASDVPDAEYWMGAHPSAPSLIDSKPGGQPLHEYIANDPSGVLGETTYKRFGELPYLFKILEVKDMLSIQVHPTKEEAEKGFARENAAGIPLNAPQRNYKDNNHKPEIMVALTEFWLLHGFLPEDKLKTVLQEVPEFQVFLPVFEKGGYKALYQQVMDMPQDAVNTFLRPLGARILPAYQAGTLDKDSAAFWAARAIANDPKGLDHLDRGIFSIYFFNVVHVQPGDGVFQDAGIPHAYLEGVNVELMANSDNVLRGGLTPKHVDVPELLKHTRFEAIHPNVLKGTPGKDKAELIYPTPAPDFQVSRIVLDDEHVYYEHTAQAAEILILLDGDATITGSENTVALLKGQCAFIAYGEDYRISSSNSALLYKATVS
ncbi:mannose-6-phosphate isomerase, type 1 [Chitinophaga costaii]|uniref:mannose-6-phosphate isomerase n=1 Tax=Chitinophaga costaii TaxID=1335309 RepID=A0A1C4FG80_9BACT|nr:mannose-6-phosphate isomerase, class I [Chitinophaga costaii]PUZ20136.1 mannose-6-phosphate isomerase, class I [Chitinophaga costaii]SCC54864.1 mannose-6-phosphate isomerase, type 1 [Chitinophaga costaii]